MNKQNRVLLHAGVNFVIAPAAEYNKADSLRFQAQLESQGVETSNVVYAPNQISIIKQSQKSSREIRLVNAGPQVSQLLIILNQPEFSTELVEEEMDRVLALHNNIWPSTGKQLLACDATIRSLYDSSMANAFQEIWEHKLVQPAATLAVFGRQIQGGGLRFVMPPSDPNDAVVELKLESYLSDPKKIYVDVQFIWKTPIVINNALSASTRIQAVESFISDNVLNFFD